MWELFITAACLDRYRNGVRSLLYKNNYGSIKFDTYTSKEGKIGVESI